MENYQHRLSLSLSYRPLMKTCLRRCPSIFSGSISKLPSDDHNMLEVVENILVQKSWTILPLNQKHLSQILDDEDGKNHCQRDQVDHNLSGPFQTKNLGQSNLFR
jgi:hypothetical protein